MQRQPAARVEAVVPSSIRRCFLDLSSRLPESPNREADMVLAGIVLKDGAHATGEALSMLQISHEQWVVLQADSASRFETRLIELLTKSFPEMGQSSPVELKRFVREQTLRARTYGFETEQDFGAYVMAAWLLGGDFDTYYAPPRLVLTSLGFTRDEKRKWLLTWVYEVFATIARKFGTTKELKSLPE